MTLIFGFWIYLTIAIENIQSMNIPVHPIEHPLSPKVQAYQPMEIGDIHPVSPEIHTHQVKDLEIDNELHSFFPYEPENEFEFNNHAYDSNWLRNIPMVDPHLFDTDDVESSELPHFSTSSNDHKTSIEVQNSITTNDHNHPPALLTDDNHESEIMPHLSRYLETPIDIQNLVSNDYNRWTSRIERMPIDLAKIYLQSMTPLQASKILKSLFKEMKSNPRASSIIHRMTFEMNHPKLPSLSVYYTGQSKNSKANGYGFIYYYSNDVPVVIFSGMILNENFILIIRHF